MNRPIALAIATAFALAGAAYAQTAEPPSPGAAATPGTTNPSRSDPSTATPGVVAAPQQPGAEATPRDRDADMSDTARTRTAQAGMSHAKNDVSAGMGVQTTAGESIGTVRDIVPNPSGRPDYVLIAVESGGRTAVPYAVVAPMIHDGNIILDRSRLQSAPRVQDSDLLDKSNTTWKRRADQYWIGGGSRPTG